MSIYLNNSLPITPTLIEWFYQNITVQVDDETKNRFLQLKNVVEGWKKGTQIRNIQKPAAKNNEEKIKENLSLYLNQLSQSNLATIQSKIAKEIEYSADSQGMLIDLILTNGLSQSNNLPVLLQLLYNLKLISQLAGILEKKLFENTLKETDASNYDQMCDFNRFNLIYKNGYIFLGLIYNKCGEISLQRLIKLFNFLETNIVDENKSKELTEKYIDIYVDFLKTIEKKLKSNGHFQYVSIVEKLTQWKDMKQKFTNRARFSILDYLDTLNN